MAKKIMKFRTNKIIKNIMRGCLDGMLWHCCHVLLRNSRAFKRMVKSSFNDDYYNNEAMFI